MKMHVGNAWLEKKASKLIKSLAKHNIVELEIENEQVLNEMESYWTIARVSKTKEECAQRNAIIK